MDRTIKFERKLFSLQTFFRFLQQMHVKGGFILETRRKNLKSLLQAQSAPRGNNSISIQEQFHS